jgi:hypothetical protein
MARCSIASKAAFLVLGMVVLPVVVAIADSGHLYSRLAHVCGLLSGTTGTAQIWIMILSIPFLYHGVPIPVRSRMPPRTGNRLL